MKIVGSTCIAMADGRNSVGIEDLAGTEFLVYCYDETKISVSLGYDVKHIGREEIYEVVLDDETSISVTEDQEFMLRNESYCELRDLRIGNSLMPLYKWINYDYILIDLNDGNRQQEHRMLLEYKLGRSLLPYPDEVCHHINGNSQDNRLENLEVMSNYEHTSLHSSERTGESNSFFGKCHSEETRSEISKALSGENNPLFGKHRSEETRSKISKAHTGRKQSKDHSDSRQKSPILMQAKWMLDNGFAIDCDTWNLHREEFRKSTDRKRSCPYTTVLKYFPNLEDLFETLNDSNHTIKKIFHVGMEPVYSLSVSQQNIAILTSKLSGIILMT